MTTILNLYGGPGTGKSTIAARTFAELKSAGVNAELVTEFAKDLVWENRKVIACQPYIFGKQLWRVQRLEGMVDVVVTDSPLAMSLVYSTSLGPAWREVVMDHHNAMDTLDVFLRRDNVLHPYNPKGRYQANVDEAILVDRQIEQLLQECNIAYQDHTIAADLAVTLCDTVLEKLSAQVVEA